MAELKGQPFKEYTKSGLAKNTRIDQEKMDVLAPSKSTVYISNLPFTLTNSDMHKIFEKHGKIVKITILKDRHTRKSKGVCFINFLKIEEAEACATAVNNLKMFDRNLKASIAKDNGRCAEFIKKRTYTDKSRCYECGESGHLSYKCPGNVLGERIPPIKAKFRKRTKNNIEDSYISNYETQNDIKEKDKIAGAVKKPKYKRNTYLSDEEDLSE